MAENDRNTALVVGGSRGIGRAIAVKLARCGFNICLTYRSNTAAAEEAKALVESEGAECELLAFDIANTTESREALECRFENDPQKHEMKIPQMGWNQVEFAREAPHFKGIPDNSYFYFVHSYYVTPSNSDVVAGETEYLRRFTSAAVKDNVFASQFHPEKSQKWGLKLLENFVKL